MTAIFRVLPWPRLPHAQSASTPLEHPTTPTGKLIHMDPSRRQTAPPFDLEAMTTVERVLLAYVLRGKPLTKAEYASLIQLCRVSTSGEQICPTRPWRWCSSPSPATPGS